MDRTMIYITDQPVSAAPFRDAPWGGESRPQAQSRAVDSRQAAQERSERARAVADLDLGFQLQIGGVDDAERVAFPVGHDDALRVGGGRDSFRVVADID